MRVLGFIDDMPDADALAITMHLIAIFTDFIASTLSFCAWVTVSSSVETSVESSV